mmetsp:Transcript_7276/g.14440  ORF Transcript_7276/g.14440 Transcript_7276/m.14440 type:complete len:97 (-) Transcript_7276:80-370(-)
MLGIAASRPPGIECQKTGASTCVCTQHCSVCATIRVGVFELGAQRTRKREYFEGGGDWRVAADRKALLVLQERASLPHTTLDRLDDAGMASKEMAK